MSPSPLALSPSPARVAPRRTPYATALLALAALAVGAQSCTDDNPAYVEPTRCADTESLYLQTFPGTHPDRVDVVVVVEQSADASALHTALPTAADDIVAALGQTDYRVGVLGSADGGQLHAGACDGDPFVRATDTDPSARLACLLAVPTEPAVASSGALGALDRLVGGTTDGSGFLRRDARLLVVVVANHDDCTGLDPTTATPERCEWQRDALTPVEDLFQALRNARPDVHAVAVAAVVGPLDGQVFPRDVPPEPACSGPYGDALHGVRYRELAALAAPWSTTESICGVADLGASLRSAIEPLTFASEARYCLGRTVSGTLRTVSVVDPARGVDLALDPDQGGVAYLSSAADCGGGAAVVLDNATRQSFTATTEVEVYFCGQ